MEAEAGRIIKLDESVVNRIAAGEIIQSPASALKELIENSLDAKSKSIVVTVLKGGHKSIQIQDNGTGILKENFPILCERFTTSKLEKFEDLQKMTTYGFRGEALSSISVVSRVTIQTKTRNDPCAYKVKYENGVMIEGPTPTAGNQGTTITFDDIFYNTPIRLKTLGSPSEEFQKIFDVVAKYSVHNHKISFTLKKHGEINSIKTLPSPTPIETIRTIYSNNVANSLLPVECSDEGLKFTMSGFISNSDYSGKKRQFLLFINHRLVDSKSLKKAIFDDVYSSILPNNVQPFVYMSIEMDPMNIDVNVSPTKNEVNFLNEDLIVQQIKESVQDKLLEVNETRKLYTQQLLPGASAVTDKSFEDREKTYAKDMVRTDHQTQTIVKFFQKEEKSSANDVTQVSLNQSRTKKLNSKSQLTSINELRSEFLTKSDEGLRQQIEKLNFVGIASRAKALIQCENVLYLCDTNRLCRELFYQQALVKFGSFDSIKFENPLKIKELALIGFDMEECAWEEEDGPKDELAQRVEELLMERRDMLRDYFNITINSNGELETLPTIIHSYLPLLSHLPLFIVRMATEVNFDDEKECFQSICKELGDYYARLSLISPDRDFKFLTETIIYPEIRKNLQPPTKFLTDETFLKLTSLQELYKVFERC